MNRTIRLDNGYTMFVKAIDRSELPEGLIYASGYTKFYVVKNFDDKGYSFFYLASGNEGAPKQIVGWYPKSKSFWPHFGTTLKSAIEGMIADGWKYA